MKVRELIEKLRQMDLDAEVHIAYTGADYWRTVLAPPVATVDEMDVKYSNYHRTDIITDDDEDVKNVVVIAA